MDFLLPVVWNVLVVMAGAINKRSLLNADLFVKSDKAMAFRLLVQLSNFAASSSAGIILKMYAKFLQRYHLNHSAKTQNWEPLFEDLQLNNNNSLWKSILIHSSKAMGKICNQIALYLDHTDLGQNHVYDNLWCKEVRMFNNGVAVGCLRERKRRN